MKNYVLVNGTSSRVTFISSSEVGKSTLDENEFEVENFPDGDVSQYLYKDGKFIYDPILPDIADTQRDKLNELSKACEDTITGGVDVTLADGTTEHFSLTATDQTNIDNIFSAVTLGATEYPYHADDMACKMYSAVDIVSIYVAEKTFITYHTTYYNALKQWINSLEDGETVKAITYGDELPEELAASMTEILASAQAQMDAIIAKMTSNETA